MYSSALNAEFWLLPQDFNFHCWGLQKMMRWEKTFMKRETRIVTLSVLKKVIYDAGVRFVA